MLIFLDCLSSHPCRPASPGTAASVMPGGRPRRTAWPARWTETSAASGLRLAQRLCSVSTRRAPSIVAPVPQVYGHVPARPEMPGSQAKRQNQVLSTAEG